MDEKLTERMSIAIDKDLIQAMDDWRRLQPSIPTRASAARMLIRRALAGQMIEDAPAPTVPAKAAAKRKAAK